MKADGAVGETCDSQIDKRELDSLGQTRVRTVMYWCMYIVDIHSTAAWQRQQN